jgi:hypothetical protein
MSLSVRKNKDRSDLRIRQSIGTYITVNTIFAGVILLIFAYSGIFSPVRDNYPVICIHEKLTGELCASCGLSHSFSLILRGKVAEAYQWNHYGMRIFLFFAAQLILRLTFSLFYRRYADTRKQLIVVDCVGSGLMFLIAFWPFIVRIISGTVHI